MEKYGTRTQQHASEVSRMQNAMPSVDRPSNDIYGQGSQVTQSIFKHLTNETPMVAKLDVQILVLLELKRKMSMRRHIHTNIAILKDSALSTSHSKHLT